MFRAWAQPRAGRNIGPRFSARYRMVRGSLHRRLTGSRRARDMPGVLPRSARPAPMNVCWAPGLAGRPRVAGSPSCPRALRDGRPPLRAAMSRAPHRFAGGGDCMDHARAPWPSRPPPWVPCISIGAPASIRSARQRCVPPAPGSRPDRDLRQSYLRLRVVGQHAVMAGEAELQTPTERSSVDGGSHWLACRFEPAEQQRAARGDIHGSLGPLTPRSVRGRRPR